MTYSDDFLAWLKKDECRLHMSPLYAQYAAWQAALESRVLAEKSWSWAKDQLEHEAQDIVDALEAFEADKPRKTVQTSAANIIRALLAERVLAERKPVCWITREQLRNVEDEGEDAWVYWAETGHVAEADEVPLFTHPTPDDASDAARYRFIKSKTKVFSLDMGGKHTYVMDYSIARLRGPSLDAAIDRAMQDKESGE